VVDTGGGVRLVGSRVADAKLAAGELGGQALAGAQGHALRKQRPADLHRSRSHPDLDHLARARPADVEDGAGDVHDVGAGLDAPGGVWQVSDVEARLTLLDAQPRAARAARKHRDTRALADIDVRSIGELDARSGGAA